MKKYLLLPALISTVIAASLTGCGDDITNTHDIYRAEYKYKPLPPQQDVALPPSAPGTPAPPPPAPDAAPPSSALPPQ